jgi:halimadienyl-diphosphate synthase
LPEQADAIPSELFSHHRRDNMVNSELVAWHQETLESEIRSLLIRLGEGKVEGVAYDTAWVARLAPRCAGYGFDRALEWLRRNQYEDGSWGGPLVQYHDRFISTLAAIVALREGRQKPRDERRVKRGENALWKIVGRLGRDDSDTIGFPIISASLANEAAGLGLDVPLPPIRFAGAYHQKVKELINRPNRNWRTSTITFSLEALCNAVMETDPVFEDNSSVALSPSATAAYLLSHEDVAGEAPLIYLQTVQQADGSVPAVAPIDLFEIAWSLNHLHIAGAIEPDMPEVKRMLDYLWRVWSPSVGAGYSRHYSVTDSDGTAACFTALKWGNYPVSAEVFEHYEADDHFYCFLGETNPALSANVRLLAALRTCDDHPRYSSWIAKIVDTLHRFDENGSFWWDKWHASPYYVSGAALAALHGVDNALCRSRFKWIMRTQNDDGGWGYLGESTPEETAYCLEALVRWHNSIEPIDRTILDAAASYLWKHLSDHRKIPLWIGKSLYYPEGPVRAAILAALFDYTSILL